MSLRAAILSTGDELTTGRIVDTNAAWIADKLIEIGVEVVCVLTVGDFGDRIAWAWQQALTQVDVAISTGGLGPTADDLTTETVARVLGRPLDQDQEYADRLRQMWAARGREMPLNNLKQAMFPTGCVVVPNPNGTAPGYRVEHQGKHIVVLPGVPREMKPMMEETILPWLRSLKPGDVYLSRTFQTFGISESALDEEMDGVVDPHECRVSFRASFPEISVRVVVHGSRDEATARLEAVSAHIRERIAPWLYGEGGVTLEEVVGRLYRERGLTVALAESCTGGLIGHRITNVPGSSAYLLGAAVVYANSAKEGLLGVRPATLAAHGAVSVETAAEMAQGARRVFGAQVGLATTGVAGPDGGTPEKPVGTVCFALASGQGVVTARQQLWGARDWVKLLASQIGLDWLRRHALGLNVLDADFFRRR